MNYSRAVDGLPPTPRLRCLGLVFWVVVVCVIETARDNQTPRTSQTRCYIHHSWKLTQKRTTNNPVSLKPLLLVSHPTSGFPATDATLHIVTKVDLAWARRPALRSLLPQYPWVSKQIKQRHSLLLDKKYHRPRDMIYVGHNE